jgi:hypothetical protein
MAGRHYARALHLSRLALEQDPGNATLIELEATLRERVEHTGQTDSEGLSVAAQPALFVICNSCALVGLFFFFLCALAWCGSCFCFCFFFCFFFWFTIVFTVTFPLSQQ